MSITEFEEKRERLINAIRAKITEDKEVAALFRLINKIALKKELEKPQSTSAPVENIAHKEALKELNEMIELWN
jgi:hypothetical protein